MKPHKLAPIAAALILSLASAQSTPPRLEFEVVSIHPSKPDVRGGGIKPTADGAGYTASVVSVRSMISVMFRIPFRQIKGGPSWIESDFYDVEAKAEKKYSLDDLHIMYMNMLADRFKLQYHMEKKEGNAYLLTIDKSGLKMKPNDKPQDYEVPIAYNGIGAVKGIRVPMPYLCFNLAQMLADDERPIVDETGLNGNYDFNLAFLPQNIPEQFRANLPQDVLDRPSLFDALREQLGLRLTAGKGAVEYMVIDHLERPTEN